MDMDTGKKILLIEDDPFLGDLLVMHMRKAGLTADLAVDGEKGLEKVRQEKPDLILLDILLPGIDGYEVLRSLKADKDFAKIPVLILSNLSQGGDSKRFKELGAVGFLIKANFDLGDIVEKIKEILTNVGHE